MPKKDRTSLATKRYLTITEMSLIKGNTFTQVGRWLVKHPELLKSRNVYVKMDNGVPYCNDEQKLVDRFDPKVSAYLKNQ